MILQWQLLSLRDHGWRSDVGINLNGPVARPLPEGELRRSSETHPVSQGIDDKDDNEDGENSVNQNSWAQSWGRQPVWRNCSHKIT